MNIQSTKLWKHPQIVLTILSKISELDPTVIFGNPQVYILKNKNKIVSFAAIKQRLGYQELKAVYTYPTFRGRRYMPKLINHISKRHKHLYLICKNSLEEFYKGLKFKKTKERPIALILRCVLHNSTIKPFSKKELIVMKN